MRRWGMILIVGLVAYFGWRKFGGTVTSSIRGILS